jgi:hypothetical protein
MNKAYVVFALLLVMLVVIFLVVRNYVSFQAEQVKEQETKQLIATALEGFSITVDSRLDESEKALLAKIDSIAYSLEEPLDFALELDSLAVDSTLIDSAAVDTTLAATDTVADTFADTVTVALVDSIPIDSLTAADTTVSDVPTEQDNEIYIRYLKKRWALPGDLTKYELAVAKQEIMSEVGTNYDLNSDEILAVIDKVYEYRRSLKETSE